MAKHPMPVEKQEKIKELLASGKNYTEVAKLVGSNRRTVALVVNPVQREKARESDRRRRERRRDKKFTRLDAEDLPEGCFNVNHMENWISGFGA